jgi:AcrR family transcriptional regulator
VSELPRAEARPRRADARQNIAAILDSAARVLGERPDAGLAEVAKAAGISRQTLYAHFPSRDALISALIERATDRVLTALDAADLDAGPADQALVRLMEAGWTSFDTDPFLLHLAAPPVTPEQDRDRHAPILERLRRVVERGRREGDIDPDQTIDWILTAVLALGHAAGEEVRAGRMTSTEAIDALRSSIPRLVRPEPPA